VALGVGIGFGAAHRSAADQVAQEFARAWDRADYPAMYRVIGRDERARFSFEAFQAAYERAAATATATVRETVVRDPQGSRNGDPLVPVTVPTRVFGAVRGQVALPVAEDGTVSWAPHLAFPDLRPGEELTRRTQAPRRGKILARDGKLLAGGPADSRELDEGAAGLAGTLAPAAEETERSRIFAAGFAADTAVGKSGLEKVLQEQVQGTPGGSLLAGGRRLAAARPRAAPPTRSTIDLEIQAASDSALAGRFGGIAVLDPRTAEVLALSGIAFSAPQPPGSTFKIVTTTAALDDRKVKLSDEFPVESAATIDGVSLSNANGELCGGSFVSSFAHSCNSVFAPLGVKVGAESLVATSEKYGFNDAPQIAGAEPSTIPPPDEIVSPLDLGSSAIGQGKVLATPLQMASVAQVIANQGVRLEPTLMAGERGRETKVTSPETARAIEKMMIDVVGYGTGVAAAVPGVKVAGKTGTAELGDTRGENALGSDPSNTDAWFTAYAPAGKPELVVAALFVRSGAGGAVAAPAVQTVLAAALDK
jgi:cell division protein FtsI/penicillin-binding protein 2